MTVAAGWIKTHLGLAVAFQFAAVMWLLSAAGLAVLRWNTRVPAEMPLTQEAV